MSKTQSSIMGFFGKGATSAPTASSQDEKRSLPQAAAADDDDDVEIPAKRSRRIIDDDIDETEDAAVTTVDNAATTVDKDVTNVGSAATKADKDVTSVDNDVASLDDEDDDDMQLDAPVTTSSAPKMTKAQAAKDYGYGRYDPVKQAIWKKGQRAPFLFIARNFTEIEKISSRLKITALLCNMFRSIISLSPDDLLPAVYLCTNRLSAAYEGEELGVGDMILMKAVCDATGRTLASVRQQMADVGDLGIIAQQSRNTQSTLFKPAGLTIEKVYKTFKMIAAEKGHSSQEKKKERIQSLLVAAVENEATFIIRALQGKLRIGSGEQTVLVALAHAVTLTPPAGAKPPGLMSGDAFEGVLAEAVQTLKTVYAELPNYDIIMKEIITGGLPGLHDRCHIMPGIPVRPMLAKPTKGVRVVLDRFENMPFTCEFKYDGERAQVHRLEDGSVKIYSRNLEDHTPKYPDVIEIFAQAPKENVKSFVLDSEVVAFDLEKNKILPFQTLSTRARKAVNIADIKVCVCVFGFDLLFFNGKSLLREPFTERRRLLRENFNVIEHKFQFAVNMDGTTEETMQAFLTQAVESNCEGLMVKTLEADSTYEPAKRSNKWLKLKKDYMDGLTDSLDLVPIGAWRGKGKRTGVYGAYLLACYDEENEEFQSVCKIGTGFSDADLEKHSEFFKEHILTGPKNYFRVDDAMKPDVWFEPKQVWEVLAADLSISPVHCAAAGLVDPVKGIALRFPRFIRIRDDKAPEDATSAQQVADMYKSQATVMDLGADDDD